MLYLLQSAFNLDAGSAAGKSSHKRIQMRKISLGMRHSYLPLLLSPLANSSRRIN